MRIARPEPMMFGAQGDRGKVELLAVAAYAYCDWPVGALSRSIADKATVSHRFGFALRGISRMSFSKSRRSHTQAVIGASYFLPQTGHL